MLQERTAARVFVWEVTAWDEWGKYGRPAPPSANAASFRALLGVNGIWGWGTNGFSSSLNGSYGPGRFAGAASHARKPTTSSGLRRGRAPLDNAYLHTRAPRSRCAKTRSRVWKRIQSKVQNPKVCTME